jgi:tetratricopeptide (TPR) repeat protein
MGRAARMIADPYAATLRRICDEMITTRRFDEAERLLHLLVGRDDDALTLYHLGHVLYEQGRFAEAEAALRRSVGIEGRRSEAFNDLGAALFRQHRDAEALMFIRQALRLDPGMAEAEESDSIWLLRYGRFREGWAKYEARYRTGEGRPLRRDFRQPQWRGEPIHDRTILLYAEQGFGDAIQFARYAPLVAARGARVILEVHAGLGVALQGLPGVSRLIENGVALPPFDLHCPLLSLPLAFGTDLDSIPASIPYITAAPDRVFAWRNRLGPRRVPRIGVAWSGNPQHREDKQRSIPLAQLAELFRDQPDREFHVLQNDVRESDRPALAALPHLRDHSRTLRDFADTAALVSLMDVVISVDTALVHLAGAMGWPVWVMLAAVPDWRWMLGRDDSPWYPSMWLFRQQRRGDWTPVLHDVARQLEDMLS